ncbi:hypothetical protein [Acetivibrio ethanolgignens]|uniref:Uncharacterized protein n=1 Tax=Acetivibrio ethanolgignens TaxID=290052 RepID=A0A0V8QIB4_9FIRM|nr:hypothetical protein [Acetivibrio ethanolgignens]KSV60288.1 hypothetical protein ASU35_05915 [Acetivibrio ethanolgignens]
MRSTSTITIQDITDKERELVQQHIDSYSAISWDKIYSLWRDSDGKLCIRYKCDSLDIWFHYDTDSGEWW